MDFNEISKTILDKLAVWYNLLIEGIPAFLLAVLVITFSGFISKYFKKATIRIVSKISDNNSLVGLSASVFSYIIIFNTSVKNKGLQK